MERFLYTWFNAQGFEEEDREIIGRDAFEANREAPNYTMLVDERDFFVMSYTNADSTFIFWAWKVRDVA
jgi:hypothetical protein